jgi:hypothetical protein
MSEVKIPEGAIMFTFLWRNGDILATVTGHCNNLKELEELDLKKCSNELQKAKKMNQ